VTDVLYELVKNKGESVGCANACEAIGVSRSGYAAWAVRVAPSVDVGLLKAIHEAAKNPRYGYRRVAVELRGQDYIISPKRVLEIMRCEGLTCKKKAFKPKTTNSDHAFKKYPNLVKNLKETSLNQVWVGDITYIWAGEKFAYLATILDRYSRKCLGWALGRTLEATVALRALENAYHCRNGQALDGLIHHTDAGVQYACDAYVASLQRRGIVISMNEEGDPRENAFAESFNKTVKYEEAYLTEYDSFEEAEAGITRFIKWYNKKRLHSSIGYRPPDEFEEEYLREVAS
jgi:transposase InsO family protein